MKSGTILGHGLAMILVAAAPVDLGAASPERPPLTDLGSLLSGDALPGKDSFGEARTPQAPPPILTGDPEEEAEIIGDWLLRGAGELAAPVPAGSRILRVGSEEDAACDYDSVQDAIDDAREPLERDVIRIARNAEYTEKALTINDKNVVLEGGYEDCGASAPDTRNTILDGTGGSNRPVIRIRNEDDSLPMRVDLNRLTIQGGTTTTSRFRTSASRLNGAGVNIRGRVGTNLTNTIVRNNETTSRRSSVRANNGGGIYIDGEGFEDSYLRLHRGSGVINNTARNDNSGRGVLGNGGGIYCQRSRVEMVHPRTTVATNTTEGDVPGNGGGIYTHRGCTFLSRSGGLFRGIFMNETEGSGGGLHAIGGRHEFRSVPGGISPMVVSNRSEGDGGGIRAYASSTVELTDTVVAGNWARGEGGGIAVQSLDLIMGRSDTPCDGASIDRCSRLDGNASGGHGGALLVDQQVLVDPPEGWETSAEITQTDITGNSSGHLGSVAMVRGISADLFMEGVAIHGNHRSSRLFQVEDQAFTRIHWSTIAGNRDPDDPPLQVFRLLNDEDNEVNTTVFIHGSIVWEPQATMFNRTGPTYAGALCTIGHEREENLDLSGSGYYSRINPRLRDSEEGDLRLEANSPAIDYCDDRPLPPQLDDLFGNPRGVPYDGSTITPPNPGTGDYDLGAHERAAESD